MQKDDVARIAYMKLNAIKDSQDNTDESIKKGFATKPQLNIREEELSTLRLMKLIRENMRKM